MSLAFCVLTLRPPAPSGDVALVLVLVVAGGLLLHGLVVLEVAGLRHAHHVNVLEGRGEGTSSEVSGSLRADKETRNRWAKDFHEHVPGAKFIR